MKKFLLALGLLLLVALPAKAECTFVENIQDWYLHSVVGMGVSDRWSTNRGIVVTTADAAYGTWVTNHDPGGSDCVVEFADLNGIYQHLQDYNLGLRRASVNPSISSAANIVLTNQTATIPTGNNLAWRTEICISTASKTVTLPKMNVPNSIPMGQPFRLVNVAGCNTFTINYDGGAGAFTGLTPGNEAELVSTSYANNAGVVETNGIFPGVLPVTRGGTANGSLGSAFGLLTVNSGGTATDNTGACTDGQLIVGQTGAKPLCKTMAGNAQSISAAGALVTTKAIPWQGGYDSGRFYLPFLAGATTGTLALAANTLYFFPIALGESRAVDRLALEVNATGTAANCKLGVYNVAAGLPTSLIQDAGNVAVGTTGQKLGTIAQTLLGSYLGAMVCDGTVTVNSVTNAQVASIIYFGYSTLATPDIQLSATFTFAALPANITFGSGGIGAKTYTAAQMPIIAVRAQ